MHAVHGQATDPEIFPVVAIMSPVIQLGRIFKRLMRGNLMAVCAHQSQIQLSSTSTSAYTHWRLQSPDQFCLQPHLICTPIDGSAQHIPAHHSLCPHTL